MRRLLPIACALLSLPLAPSSQARAGVPYDIAVEVAFVEGGSRELQEAIEGRLRHRLVQKECVEAVRTGEAAADADLRFRLELDWVREELEYALTLDERLRYNDPKTETSYTAVFEVTGRYEIVEGETGRVVRTAKIRTGADRRPISPYEDAEAYARGEGLDKLVKILANSVCNGPKKLIKRVEAARESRDVR